MRLYINGVWQLDTYNSEIECFLVDDPLLKTYTLEIELTGTASSLTKKFSQVISVRKNTICSEQTLCSELLKCQE
jgi:hypothetical protein